MKRKLFTYLLAAACTVAAFSCKKAEEDFFVDPLQEREVFVTASMGLNTRSVSVSSEAIAASWQEGDELSLVLDGAVVTTLKVTSIFGQKAMLSGTVKGAYPAGTSFDLYYGGTSYQYGGQMGTAASAAIRGYLKASGVTIASQDNKTLTLSAATLQHQQAYFELSFQYGPDKLKVKRVEITGSDKIVRSKALDGTTEYFTDTNPFVVGTYGADGAEVVYFAMRDEKTETFNYTFKVYPVGSDTPYEAEWKWEGENGVSNPLSKTGPAVNGKYNVGTWVLNRQSTNTNVPQAISILWDGQEHELITVNALTYGAGSAEAEGAKMLFYVAAKQEADAVLDADAVAALAPDDNATWSTEIPVKSDPGQYYIWYKVIGGRYFEDIPATLVKESGAVTENDPTDNRSLIDKRSLTVTAPSGIANLKYTGSAQALVNAGSLKDAASEEFDPGLAIKYYVAYVPFDDDPTDDPVPTLEGVTAEQWSETLPSSTNAGKYYVWCKVDGNDHYYGAAPAAVTVPGSNDAFIPIATSDAVIANPEPIVNLIYNGEYQQLVLPADASDGCKVYYYVTTSNLTREAVVALDNSVWVAPADLTDPTSDLYKEFVPAPKKRDAGTYYIWTKVVDNSGGNNYSGVPGISEAAVVARIAPIPITVTAYPQENWTYDGVERKLMTQWITVTYKNKNNEDDNALDEPTPAKLYYKFPGETSFTLFTPASPQDIPDITNAGSYTVQYYVEGAPNFESYKSASDPASFTVVVYPAMLYVTLPAYVSDPLTYTGNDQPLLAGAGTLQYYRNSQLVTYTPDDNTKLEFMWTRKNFGSSSEYNAVSLAPLAASDIKGSDAGTYTVRYKVKRSSNFVQNKIQLYNGSAFAEVNNTYNSGVSVVNFTAYTTTKDIARADLGSSFTVTIEGWTYGEAANDPIVDGNAGNGDVTYTYKLQSAGDGDYSGTVPTNAGNYTVRAEVATTNNYNSATATANFTIAQANAVVTPSLPILNLVFNDERQELVTDAIVRDGCKVYYYVTTSNLTREAVVALDNSVWVAPADLTDPTSDLYKEFVPAPKKRDAGTYYIWTKVVDNSGGNNYSGTGVSSSAVEVTIDKAPGSVELDVSELSFTSAQEVNSTQDITVVSHAGPLSSSVICDDDSDEGKIEVEETTPGTFTVTRKSALANVDNITVKIEVNNANYTPAVALVTVTMAAIPPLALVTQYEIGMFIGTDGDVYAPNSTLPDGVSLVAMIAYVGSNSNCDHGVAISLADGPQGYWSEDSSTWAASHGISNTPSGSAWRVPSQDDIEKMYTACNPSLSTTSLNSLLKAGNTSYGFTETGGYPTWYWTSTVNDNDEASIFREIGDSSTPGWDANSTDPEENRVNTFRYVFAF